MEDPKDNLQDCSGQAYARTTMKAWISVEFKCACGPPVASVAGLGVKVAIGLALSIYSSGIIGSVRVRTARCDKRDRPEFSECSGDRNGELGG